MSDHLAVVEDFNAIVKVKDFYLTTDNSYFAFRRVALPSASDTGAKGLDGVFF